MLLISNTCNSAAKDLVKSMLCVDTSRRYTARKILDDPWFTVSTRLLVTMESHPSLAHFPRA